MRSVTESAADHQAPTAITRCRALRRRVQRGCFDFYSRFTGWSFQAPAASSPLRWRNEHWVLGAAAVVLAVLIGAVMPVGANATRRDVMTEPHTTVALPLPPLPAASVADAGIGALAAGAAGPDWQVVKVRTGQSLSDIFHEENLSASDLQRALDAPGNGSSLRNIRPGQEFAFTRDADGNLTAMRFERDDATRVVMHFTPGNVTQDVEGRAVERRIEVAHAELRTSLFDAGERAGMSDAMILKLAKAFGYDIDFAQDLRVGDSFSVIYDEVYRDGERLRDGDILAATFINQGHRYTAIRFTDASGEAQYYSEDGRPLRKSFLRTPVDFTRISSRFSVARMHPILGYMRAHRGVDYAAPMGTPIKAAGDGKIIFRGWKSGYGNFVVIQHNRDISTAYGHMSRFANEKVGQRVHQGQVIGFVGMTGLATGPHLHYEFRVDGVHRDPLTVTMPKAEPLPPSEMIAFRRQSKPLLAKLDFLGSYRLARTDP